MVLPDNGRSLYIVDWRMVVVGGGNVLHHVKREGELSGRGNVRESVSGGYVQGKCPDVRLNTF